MKVPRGNRGCTRFPRHGGIYRSDVRFKTWFEFLRCSASRWSAAGSAEGRGFYPAPCSSSAMSSGRLFLDQVARQQSLSPLHRQPHGKTRAFEAQWNFSERQPAQTPVVSKKGAVQIAPPGSSHRRQSTPCRPPHPGNAPGPPLLSRDIWRIIMDKWRMQLLSIRPPPAR